MSLKLSLWGYAAAGVLVSQAIAVASLVSLEHSPVSGLALGVAAGLGLVTVSVWAWWVGERWQRQVAAVNRGIAELGQGNLRFRPLPAVQSELSEVLEQLATTRDGLRNWANEVSGATTELCRAQEALQAGSERTGRSARGISGLSSRVFGFAADQTSLLRDAIDALMAFDDMIGAAQDNANEAETIYRRTFETVGVGKESLDKLLDAMVDLRNSVHRSTDGVVDLSREVLSIGDIVQTVHTIAKKTNLLAINAGIAAAQAGEKGQAFAIIAEEIRQLATQTSSALASIQDILGRVQGRTKEVASAIGLGTRKVAEGEAAAKDAGRAIAQTREAMGQSTDQVGEILRASTQVKGAADRLIEKLIVVSNLAQETQKGARSVASQGEDHVRALAEVSGVVSVLAEQTQQIERLVAHFRR